MKGFIVKVFLISITLFSSRVLAYAQVIPPANVDPGVISNTNLNNSFDNSIDSQTQKAKIKNTDSIIESEIEDTNEPPQLKAEIIKLNKIVFSGNTIFKSSDLEKYISQFRKKDLTINNIKNITILITNLYKSRGYITCFAYIPEQKITDNTLQINIFEGKIGEININGTKWVKKSYLKNSILKSNDLEKNKIFNINNLKNSINKINNISYLKGHVNIEKGKKAATTDITLNIKEKAPLSLRTSLDNQGRDLIGIHRRSLFLTNNNLTGFGDSLSGGLSFASRTFGAMSNYSMPLGPKGTEFKAGYSFSNVNIGGAFEALKMKGTSHFLSFGITQPVYKKDNFSLISDISFDSTNSKTTLLDSITTQDYKARVLRLGINGYKEDKSGRLLSRAEISAGLPVLGGSALSEYGIGSSKFIKFKTNLIRVQKLPFNSMGIFRISGQFTPDTLLPSEQILLGGMNTVRGFSEGLLVGDVGYNAGFEIRKGISILPDINIPYKKNKKLTIKLKNKIQLAAFYDQGLAKTIHNKKRLSYTNFLQGVGIGLRCSLSKFLMGNIDLGIPLGKKRSLNQKSVQLHFSLSSSLF